MTTQSALFKAAMFLAGAAVISRGWRGARRMSLVGRSALITGGSRGLGLLLARELGRYGARVTLVARDARELDTARRDLEARGIEVVVRMCDLTDHAAAARLVEEVATEYGGLDILINNAGIIQVGPVEHMQMADFEQAMDLHFWAPLHMMRAAIPVMRRQGGGRIVNISSIGGKIGVSHLVPYCASKFALTGLSTAIRAELVKDGVRVTTVTPGLMRTGSPFNAWFKGRHRDEFTWFAVSDSLPLVSIAATRAARQIVDACRRGDPEIVIGWPAKLAVVANALAPGTVALAMGVANAALPRPIGVSGNNARSGWQSLSSWAPSRLTRLTERAAAENNQLPSGGVRAI